MKQIAVNQGLIVIIDDEDFDLIARHKWTAEKDRNTFYASARMQIEGRLRKVRLHRFLIGAKNGEMVDHKDGNGLNNQRQNLRLCNSQQNNANRASRGGSKFKGVCSTKIKRVNKCGTIKIYRYWQASIQIDGKSKILGRFKIEEDAARAYNKAAAEKYGEFAKLNQI